jgi:hypothetical protein
VRASTGDAMTVWGPHLDLPDRRVDERCLSGHRRSASDSDSAALCAVVIAGESDACTRVAASS